ncbi:hypothetical protein G7Y41_08705 [Schaalia sp. ZJ405]|uniref:hypothetical protein n=1 Tax=Schaalia sp. ZJ405 TaxID=2709403 RepID=UPI0013EAC47B|nr:hypothetical protein [Schaalia sp. ZJ405]QPK81104.1 hypothetical protein G7Y41_08705 [Schaalia sp. ZJ405]
MAGYNMMMWKSNNAVAAEREGMVVASKITKKWLADAGITEPVMFIKWLVRIGLISEAEWHHTSKFYNRVNYYRAEDIVEDLKRLNEYGRLAVLRQMFSEPQWRKAHTEAIRWEMIHRVNAAKDEV